MLLALTPTTVFLALNSSFCRLQTGLGTCTAGLHSLRNGCSHPPNRLSHSPNRPSHSDCYREEIPRMPTSQRRRGRHQATTAQAARSTAHALLLLHLWTRPLASQYRLLLLLRHALEARWDVVSLAHACCWEKEGILLELLTRHICFLLCSYGLRSPLLPVCFYTSHPVVMLLSVSSTIKLLYASLISFHHHHTLSPVFCCASPLQLLSSSIILIHCSCSSGWSPLHPHITLSAIFISSHHLACSHQCTHTI